MTIRSLALSLAALAVAAAFSLAPASAGTYEDNVFRPGEPRWGSPVNSYVDRNVQYPSRHHGRGGRHAAPQPYIYPRSRTCVRWMQRNGVGPKIIIGTYAC